MVEALHVDSFTTEGGHGMRLDGALVLSSLLQQVYTPCSSGRSHFKKKKKKEESVRFPPCRINRNGRC